MSIPSAQRPAITVKPADVRCPALSRGFNQRWIAAPEYVRMVTTPQGVATALSEAVNQPAADPARTRVTVRSGGHCYEDFVCGDDVRVIVSRQAGLTVDYLYAVEVAVVTERRTVDLVVACAAASCSAGTCFTPITSPSGRTGSPTSKGRRTASSGNCCWSARSARRHRRAKACPPRLAGHQAVHTEPHRDTCGTADRPRWSAGPSGVVSAPYGAGVDRQGDAGDVAGRV